MTLKRIERGWAGHFICGIHCQWHRNTLVIDQDTNDAIVVSSVGQMPNPLNKNEYSQIGAYRYYETMVFMAIDQDGYLEPNIKEQIETGQPWYVSEYPEGKTDLKAEEIHEKNVEFVIENFSTLIKRNNEK